MSCNPRDLDLWLVYDESNLGLALDNDYAPGIDPRSYISLDEPLYFLNVIRKKVIAFAKCWTVIISKDW